jgi:hypothetical protein
MRVDREDWQLEVECQNATSRLYTYPRQTDELIQLLLSTHLIQILQ